MIDPIFYPVMGIATFVSLVVAMAVTLIQKRSGKNPRFLRYFLVMFIGCLLALLAYLKLSGVFEPTPPIPRP